MKSSICSSLLMVLHALIYTGVIGQLTPEDIEFTRKGVHDDNCPNEIGTIKNNGCPCFKTTQDHFIPNPTRLRDLRLSSLFFKMILEVNPRMVFISTKKVI